MKYFILLFTIVISMLAQPLATVIKIDGKVKVLKEGSIKKTKVKMLQKLNSDDLIITYKNSMATIKLNDGSIIILDANSKLKINSEDMIKHNGGKIFFNIKKRTTNSLKVATNFATIGVKGTKFIINNSIDLQDVSLKSGLVNIESNNGEFELHKRKHKKLSLFEQYKLAQQNNFNTYKTKLEEEFVEYKKQFDLLPNRTISFNGNKVYEDITSKDKQNEFLQFESFFN